VLNSILISRALKFLFLGLAFAALAKGDDTLSFVASPYKASLYPNPRFPLKGKLLYIFIDETKSRQSSVTLFYLPNDGIKMYAVTKSLENMNQMMRNEFPDGLDVDRANEILSDILFDKWNSYSEMAPNPGRLDHLDQPETDPVPSKECLRLVNELLTTPKIEIQGNHWIAFRVVFNDLDGISFRKFSGTLKPLMIMEYNETVLLADDPSKVRHHWTEYWTDDILQKAIKQKNDLLSKQLAAWEAARRGKPQGVNPNIVASRRGQAEER